MPDGYYLTCDDAECAECFAEHGGLDAWLRDGGFEGWSEPLAILSSEESDTPTHCVSCGRLIEHELTDHGYGYVADAIIECFGDGRRSPVVQIWLDGYESGIDSIADAMEDRGLDAGTVLALFRKLPLDTGDWARKYLEHIAHRVTVTPNRCKRPRHRDRKDEDGNGI